MERYRIALLLAILALGFLLRLYRFDNPIADWHSWRQADTSSVSREFLKQGFDILHPKFHDLSTLSGIAKENPLGLRFVEFPIYNLFQAGLFKVFGTITLEQWGRLITIFSSLASAVFIFLIVRKYAGQRAGFFAGIFYTLLPYNIYYGRVILPDPMTVMAYLGGIYFFDKWLDVEGTKAYFWFFISVILVSVSLLLKPFAAFFLLPIAYLAWIKFGKGIWKNWKLWLFAIVCVTPFMLWRAWMGQYPEGIPNNSWLFNDGNIRFKGAYFYHLFADKISRLILGYFGVALVTTGLLRKIDKNTGFLLSFAVSSLAFLIVIAKGNVNHDYYQILIVPSLVILMSLGVDFLIEQSGKLFPKITGYGIILVCSLFSFMFGWYFVRDYFNINNPVIVEAGKTADRILPKDAKVIAPYGGDTAFLYQTNRLGWPLINVPTSDLSNKGATHLIYVNPSLGDLELAKGYKIIYQATDYVIYQIKSP
ncbi:MAG: glycosyltransferase family 39 protein [Candidatus Levybacteria bacterium]|nr:glycosyltransferase family 39 protein [Candidatus Levybacteria bacterium]